MVDRVGPSVALVLVVEGGTAQGKATGLVVRGDGILLTLYHVVKDARTVQVRLKNGELFDRIDLLAYDERRDVAALRISGTGLPTVPTANLGDVRAGQQVYVISHGVDLNWTATGGTISGVKMADEVPGAGQGYRLLAFTAPISPDSSGGVLFDAQGRALGIVVGTVGQSLNFAVPLESVLGLAQMSGGTALGTAPGLPPTTQEATTPPPEPARPPRRTAEVFATPDSEPEVQPINPGGSELSRAIESRDPTQILRTFRTVYVISKTVWLKLDLMQEALHREPALAAWNVTIVSDPRVADVRLSVDRVLFTWTWTYEMVHQNTGIVLGTGKFNATAGGSAASKIAKAVVERIGAARGMPAGMTAPKRQ